MIKEVIDHINDQLDDIGFTQRYGLTSLHRIIQEEIRSFPAVYCGKGESLKLSFDKSVASLYHRKAGPATIENQDGLISACDITTTHTHPMKLVAIFPRSIYGGDDAYADHDMADNLVNQLSISDIASVRTTHNLFQAEVSPTGHREDAYEIWIDEFSGVPYRVPSTHGMVEITYNIILVGERACFTLNACP